MYKAKQAFFAVHLDKTVEVSETITGAEYASLPNGYKEFFEPVTDEVTVVVDEQILELNPELAEAGVKVGDEVTFSEAADPADDNIEIPAAE